MPRCSALLRRRSAPIAVTEQLCSPLRQASQTACWFLARLGDARALSPLAQCLQSEHANLRVHLIECLEHEPDPDVRMYAAHSLGMVRGQRLPPIADGVAEAIGYLKGH